MTKHELATRIHRRIQSIPASKNGFYMSTYQTTLYDVLDRPLLERICDDAAEEALSALEQGSQPQ